MVTDEIATAGLPAVNAAGINEILHGVYGHQEWIISSLIRKAYQAGTSFNQIEITWLLPSNVQLVDIARSFGYQYLFMNDSNVMLVNGTNVATLYAGHGKIDVNIYGSDEWLESLSTRLDKQFRRAESMIEWVYNARGDEVSMPLNYRPAINSAYPWLDQPIEQFIDEYLASTASVLILIGPPGTGKTTFIKNLIHRSGGNAKVAYDTKVMEDDQLFASFIEESDTKFLVMEDADAFLEARSDGNTMMHKFLNVSDGLLSAADKKMVFSTNLPSVRTIDSALMRPGRCFSTVTFRALTIPEAQAVLDEIGSDKTISHDKNTITLAELLSGHQPSQARARSIGFTP